MGSFPATRQLGPTPPKYGGSLKVPAQGGDSNYISSLAGPLLIFAIPRHGSF